MDSCSIGIVLKNLTDDTFFIIEGFEKLKMASNMSANTGFSTIIIISYNDFKYVCAYFVIKSWRMIKGETSLVLRRL